MKLILSSRAARRHRLELERLGCELTLLEPLVGLNAVVADHPDTLVFEGRELLSAVELDVPHLRAATLPRGGYPTDVTLNALRLGDCLFGRLKSLAPELIELSESENLRLVDVKQGYARCSVLPLESSAVTADRALAKALIREGFDVLELEPGHIALEGCGYGFIGGASAVDSKNRRVIFYGSLDSHPSGREIRDFCRKCGFDVTELDGELTDFGGGIFR